MAIWLSLAFSPQLMNASTHRVRIRVSDRVRIRVRDGALLGFCTTHRVEVRVKVSIMVRITVMVRDRVRIRVMLKLVIAFKRFGVKAEETQRQDRLGLRHV